MKKIVNYLFATVLGLSATLVSSCDKKDDEGVKSYKLSVAVSLADEDVYFADLGVSELSLSYSKGNGSATEVKIDTLGTELSLPQGVYSISVSGKLSASRLLSGSTSVELYGDGKADVKLSQIASSPLIFRAIRSCGGIKGYTRDNFFEIVNNSDEVQYLDGVLLGCMATGNFTTASAWLDYVDSGIYPADIQGFVVAFPGSGKEHPLEPGKAVVIANDATNHSAAAAEGNLCPDLSKADWEVFVSAEIYSKTKDTDYADVPNLEVVHYVSNDVWCQSLLNGGAFIFKLPEGTSIDDYVKDPANLATTPGTTSATQYLMVPSEYVLDAVSLYNPTKDRSTIRPFFATWDEADGVAQATQWSGKGVRRKVSKVVDGRAYFQDTNNSFQDFLTNVDVVPGAEYNTVDE